MHGSAPTVGVMGYLVGGGLSFYGRAHGLAANHVRAFEVVTPDGRARRADADENPELFWALRGGGGGYAVITAVEIGLLPYARVTGGALFFAAGGAGAAARVAGLDPHRSGSDDDHVPRPPAAAAAPRAGAAARRRDGLRRRRLARPRGRAELDRRLRAVAPPILGGSGRCPARRSRTCTATPRSRCRRSPTACCSRTSTTPPWTPSCASPRPARRCSPPSCATSAARWRRRPPAPAPAAGWRASSCCSASACRGPTAWRPWRRTSTTCSRRCARPRPAPASRASPSAGRSLRTCVPDAALERLARLRAELDPDGAARRPAAPVTKADRVRRGLRWATRDAHNLRAFPAVHARWYGCRGRAPLRR